MLLTGEIPLNELWLVKIRTWNFPSWCFYYGLRMIYTAIPLQRNYRYHFHDVGYMMACFTLREYMHISRLFFARVKR